MSDTATLLGTQPAGAAVAAGRRARRVRRVAELGPLAIGGLVLLAVIVAAIALAPLLAPRSPTTIDVLHKLQPPSGAALLGTDSFGRDVLSRVLWGGRTTLLIGVLVIAIAAGVGIPLGLLAGQSGGWLDDLMMRVADAMLAFPSLVLAIAIASVLGASLTSAMLAVAIAYTPQFARLARGQSLGVSAQPFVDAARAAGAGRWRLLARHVAPNCIGPLGVQASLNLGGAILATASLGFLGLGVQPPTPEWGADVAASTAYIRESPWAALWPGLAIVACVLAVNLVADGLVDYLNPRLRRR
jgi:peptide/nickel transport system permease protein